MPAATSIDARGLGVSFCFDGHKRVMTPARARLARRPKTTWGLRGVDLSAEAGEGIALVGPSGSGKTTLLRVLADVVAADEGDLTMTGRVGSLLSIDAGLTPTLTGRENAILLAVLAGLSRSEAKASIGQIEQESVLGDAFDRPASSYSQGMRARLALAAAERAEPSVLLLDEVHEALDHEFRLRLVEHARALVERGGIVVAAGHDHEILERLCTRALWLEDGEARMDGSFAAVRDAYLRAHATAAPG